MPVSIRTLGAMKGEQDDPELSGRGRFACEEKVSRKLSLNMLPVDR